MEHLPSSKRGKLIIAGFAIPNAVRSDPELVATYIDMRRRHAQAKKISQRTQSSGVITNPSMKGTEKLGQGLPKSSVELMEEAEEKRSGHTDSPVLEKLITNVTPSSPDEPRFNVDGVLLTYKDENMPTERGLHHHRDEPERPDYSLEELLELTYSPTTQQRLTAVTTLANIIEKSGQGGYDKVLQPTPLTVLSQSNLLLLLRYSLDDTSIAVIAGALRALRAFLYIEADEICLDRLYGFQYYEEPVLTPKTRVEDISNLEDHQLAQSDAIAALLKTDILSRISYILDVMRPPSVAVTCALEILIRITRHSFSSVLQIVNTTNLLGTIIEYFTVDPETDSYITNFYPTCSVLTATRFCRILIYYGRKSVAEKLNNGYQIMSLIMPYVSCDAGEASFSHGIEILRLWRTLLLYDEGTEVLIESRSFLVSQLERLLSKHDIRNASEPACEYATALIAVASHSAPLKENISALLSNWSTQLMSLDNITWDKAKLVTGTLLATNDSSAIKMLNISKTTVFSKLISTSNLLSGLATEREPSGLFYLSAGRKKDQSQPAVSQESCLPFLSTVLNLFVNHRLIEEIRAVMNHPELKKYLSELESTEWSLERSWYTRPELSFLVAVVNAASIVKNDLDNRTVHIIWKIAVKLVSTLPADRPSDVKKMLRAALESRKLSIEVVTNELENLNLDSGVEDIKLNLNRDVADLYERFVPLNGEWSCTAMPKDWFYLPVVDIYTKCRNSEACNDDDKSVVLAILTLELILPDLVEMLPLSLRFSRLVLAYLCDTLYLSKDVSALLTRTVTTLLKDDYKKLDFTVDLPGLNSFTDLFTAMCKHFCSTSASDYGFSMALLAPIAQRHDVHYRKLLWSEHAGLLRFIRLPLEQSVVPLNEYFYPLERDTSLIESYMTALVEGIVKPNWCPIPYAIALHHSAMYLKQSSELALRMKNQLTTIPDKDLVALLLNYNPPDP